MAAPPADDHGNLHTDYSWLPSSFLLLKVTDNHICGIVKTKEELDKVIQCHSLATITTFAKWSDDLKRKEKLEKKRLLWSVEDLEDNVPMSVDNRVILSCQYGKLHKRLQKSHKNNGEPDLFHLQKRTRIRKSLKVNCPAKILIRYITRYEAFRVKAGGDRIDRQFALDCVTEFLEKKLEMKPPPTTVIHVKLPMVGAHQNHHISLESAFAYRVQPSLDVTSVSSLKKLLRQFHPDLPSQNRKLARQIPENPEKGRGRCADLYECLSDVSDKDNKSEDMEDITKAQTEFRDVLERLCDQSYLCLDKQTLVNATREIESLCKQLSENETKEGVVHRTLKNELEETISIYNVKETGIPDEATLHIDGACGNEQPSALYHT